MSDDRWWTAVMAALLLAVLALIAAGAWSTP